MIADRHERFARLINESLAGAISAEEQRALREHLAHCASCKEYLNASNRVLLGLSGFSFEVNPTLNVRVVEALTLKVEQNRSAHAGRSRTLRPHHVPMKVRVAFAGALLMSFAGSALVYQTAKRLALPVHFYAAQVQIGVFVFWLLPSLCAAACLLAEPREKRGLA